jgi:hypothetical protein
MPTGDTTRTGAGYGVSPPSRLGKPSPLLCRLIDPFTGEVLSMTDGQDPIDAQVINAIKRVRGSGQAVRQDGWNPERLRKMTPEEQNTCRAMVRTALKRLTDAGDIRFKGATFELFDEANNYVQVLVEYVNLRSLDQSVRKAQAPLTGRIF